MKKWVSVSNVFKRIFLAAVLSISCYFTQAQSFNMGLLGSVGGVWLLNTNISASTQQGYRFVPSDNYGAQFAINFRDGVSLEADILQGNMNQGYSGSFHSSGFYPFAYFPGESYKSEIKLNVFEFPLLFRYKPSASGLFMEIGIEYQAISSVTYTATYENPAGTASNVVTKYYQPLNFPIVAGFGLDKRIAKTNFYLKVETRIEYGLIDIQGLDGHGQPINTPTLYTPNNSTMPAYYSSYQGTHSLEVSLGFGIFYKFPLRLWNKDLTF